MQVQNNARILQRNFFKTNLKQLLLSKLNLSFLVALLLVCLTASSAFATTYTFTETVDKLWTTSGNWSPSYLGTNINATDVVFIDASSECIISGTLNNYGTLTNNGYLHIYPGSNLINDGNLINDYHLANDGNLINDGTLINDYSLFNDGTLHNNSGGILSNLGWLWVHSGSNLIINPTGTFSNIGTVKLNSGGGLELNTATQTLMAGVFNWTGGDFEIGSNASVTLTSNLSVPPNGALQVNGTLNIPVASTFSNAGTVELNSGGDLELNTITQTLMAGVFNWTGGDFEIGSNASVTLAANLSVPSNGTLQVNGTLNIPDTKTLTIESLTNFNNGSTLSNAGTVELNSGGNLNLNTSNQNLMAGVFNWTGGDFEIGPNASVTLAANFSVPSNGILTINGSLSTLAPNIPQGSTGGSIINNGTITNNNGLSNKNSVINNNGAVINNNSILTNHQLTGVFTNSGTINNNVSSQFNNIHLLNINSTGVFNNSGHLQNISPGTINNHGIIENTNNFTSTGVLNLNTGANLILNTTSVSWPPGTFNWTGGTMTIGGNGVFTLASSRSIAAGTKLAIDGTLNIPSGKTLTSNLGGEIIINASGVLTNQSGGTLINDGTLTTSGTLTNSTGATLDLNSGSNFILASAPASVPSGNLNWNGGSTITVAIGADLIIPTSLTIPAAAILQVKGTLTINGALVNEGNLIDRGTINNNGSLDLNSGSNLLLTKDPSALPEGTFSWNPGSTVTITDTAKFIIASSFSIPTSAILSIKGDLINNGTLTNNGTLELDAGGLLELNSNPAAFPSGTFNWNGGSVTVGATGALILASPLTIPLVGNFTVNGSLTNNDVFTFIGDFRNNGTTINNGTLDNQSFLINTGTISLETGSHFKFNNGFDAWSPSLFVWKAGASVEVAQGTTLETFADMTTESGRIFIVNGILETYGLNFTNNGILKGGGYIFAEISHGSTAKIEPGNSIGTLAVSGDSDLSSATYTAEMDPIAGTTDLMSISGQATLTNATLEVTWLNNPTVTGTYTVMTFGSKVGEFATVTIPTVSGFTFSTAYTTTAVTITATAVALPIELLYIRGEALDQSNKITWASATEENSSHFEVERSSDGITFEMIGIVAANGNTVTNQSYVLLDEKPLQGIGYYRLKMVDLDDTFEYSNVVSVSFNKKNNEIQLSISPNPATDVVHFAISKDEINNAIIEIHSITGQLIFQKMVNKNDTNPRFDWNTEGAVKGIYIATLTSGNERRMEKIIIQ